MAQSAQLISYQTQGPELGFRVTLTAENYVNATGLTVDLSSAMPQLGVDWAGWKAIGDGPGSNGLGPYVTPSATPNQVNVRLWNGTTEQATAAVTLTFNMRLVQFTPLV